MDTDGVSVGGVAVVDVERTVAEAITAYSEEKPFAGVVRLDRGDETEFAAAYGLADRQHGIPMTPDTRLAVASGSKVFTALVVLALVEDGVLALDAPVRPVLGGDLPLIDDRVTVEHLLSHRSGIGDYLDEDGWEPEQYLLSVPVHELTDVEKFLPMLEGRPQRTAPGDEFRYCNGGFMVLALVAQRASGVSFHDLVRRRVCEPAGLRDTGFVRSDALPGRTAVGYVLMDGEWRSNVFHLPVLGNGDGGAYTTAEDVHRFWRALFAGRIVSPGTVKEMVRPRSVVADAPLRYGLGVWLHGRDERVMIEGGDTGVSFRSIHDPRDASTCTVLSNTVNGAWRLTRALEPGWD